MVKVRVEAQAVPPSTCVTLVESRLQVSLARTNANTAVSSGMLAGLQPSGTVPSGALIVGVAVWPQASCACQVRVAKKVLPQVRLVRVLRIVMAAVPQVSLAVGASKVRLPTPHSLVLLAAQVIVGGVVSCTVIICVQKAELP